MQVHKIFTGTALFALLMVASMFILGNLITSYDSDKSTSTGGLGEIYNLSQEASSELYGNFDTTKNDTLLADVEGADQSADSLIKGAYKATKNAPKTVSISAKMIGGVARTVGVPTFFVTYTIIFLGVALIFGVVYLIFRYKG